MRFSIASLLLISSMVAPAHAAPDVGTAVLVKDLEPAVTEPFPAFPVFRPLEVGSAVYFFQDDGVHGIELWRSDGTAAGTGMVVDLCPGRCDAAGDHSRGLAAAGPLVLFPGTDGIHGVELWATDGTPGGTHLVKDLRVGADSSLPDLLLSASGLAYFTAEDGVHGRELWRSDGTESGTVLFAELVSGSTGSEIDFVGAAPGFVYVGARSGATPGGVWRCDGTPGGTIQLTTTPVGANTLLRTSAFLVLPDGRLLFSGQENPHDRLWISDGTVAGTHRFMAPDLGPAGPHSFFLLNGFVHFVARASSGDGAQRLWKTNGTAAGTVEIPLPVGVALSTGLDRLGVVGSRAILMATDSTHGLEPWVLDNDVLTLLKDVYPGSISSMRSVNYLEFFVAEAANRVFFFGDDGIHGFEVWSTDGTSGGTQRVTDLPATGSTWPFDGVTYLTQRSRYLGPLFFRVADPLLGQRLWKSDGTVAGTAEVADLSTETTSIFPTWRPPLYAPREDGCAEPTGSRLLFSTSRFSSGRNELWGTDGSGPGTVRLSTLVDSQGHTSSPACAHRGGMALFYGPAGSSWALFKTDGTVAGTAVLLPDLVAAGAYPESSQPTLVDLGTRHAGTYSGSLVRTDGSPAGSFAEAWGDLGIVTSSGGSLWGADSSRLVRSDGTAAGTQVLFDGGYELYADISELSPLGGGVAFLATRAETGRELWWSDGTAAGTALVVDLLPGTGSAAHPREPIMSSRDFDRRLHSLGAIGIASLDDGIHGTELWRTDGTAAGTVLLKDIYPGSYPSTPRHLVRVGDVVYFAAEDELHGLELWVTDGTSDGTRLVRDLVPGAESSVPQELTEVKGRLYFTAWRPSWGREAFQTDGTEAGTLQVADVWPGTGSGSPSRFAAVRDTLYFAANDGVHGFELFKMSDPTLLDLFADGFEGGALDEWSRHTSP